MGEKLFDREFPLCTNPVFAQEPFGDVEAKFLQLFAQYKLHQ
jgi:hypothetical protein